MPAHAFDDRLAPPAALRTRHAFMADAMGLRLQFAAMALRASPCTSDVRCGFLCNPRLIVRRFLVEA
jgi:hypothetical protein